MDDWEFTNPYETHNGFHVRESEYEEIGGRAARGGRL